MQRELKALVLERETHRGHQRAGAVQPRDQRRVEQERSNAVAAMRDHGGARLRQIYRLALAVAVDPPLVVGQPIDDLEVGASEHGAKACADVSGVGGEQRDEGGDRRRAIQRSTAESVTGGDPPKIEHAG